MNQVIDHNLVRNKLGWLGLRLGADRGLRDSRNDSPMGTFGGPEFNNVAPTDNIIEDLHAVSIEPVGHLVEGVGTIASLAILHDVNGFFGLESVLFGQLEAKTKAISLTLADALC